jgi:hypothetical protein
MPGLLNPHWIGIDTRAGTINSSKNKMRLDGAMSLMDTSPRNGKSAKTNSFDSKRFRQ